MLMFLLLLQSCAGCCGGQFLWWEINCDIPLPDDDGREEEPPPDTAETDTADSGDIDTGPPPMCEVVTSEPNNTADEAVTLPMADWACGYFESDIDPEYFTFHTDETGWLQIKVEAAARGSSADVQLNFFDSEGQGVFATDGYLTTDPYLLIPLSRAGDYSFYLSESFYGAGEAYSWWVRASISKEPELTWDMTEEEPNGGPSSATVMPLDVTTYGVIEEAGDYDWYHFSLPEDVSAVTFRTEAFAYGSPVNLTLVLYSAEELAAHPDDPHPLRTDRTGEIDYDLDPFFTYRVTSSTSHDWFLLVKNEVSVGSPYHWYTMNVTAERTSPDTAEETP